VELTLRPTITTNLPLSNSGRCDTGQLPGRRAAKEETDVRSRDARSERHPIENFQLAMLAHPKPTRCSGKEVIQPQVPLRLPCYDFAPVIALAFGRSAPCGFLHGLRALTTPMA
jgi:hypothetical protein